MAQRGGHLLALVDVVRRTGEVLSKLVLLAGDHLMKSPTRCEQPRA
jgi:hypothetical protein